MTLLRLDIANPVDKGVKNRRGRGNHVDASD